MSSNPLTDKSQELEKFKKIKDKSLTLDMTRGKPSKAQLDLANPMLSLPGPKNFQDQGVDCRNYGGLDGLESAKKLFAPLCDAKPEQMLIGGNASLSLMHDSIWRAMSFGVVGSRKPWGQESRVAFLCPVPGYDRHFSILEHFGIEMIPVPLFDDGPDMAMVEAKVQEDEAIKGIFCVPKYSNPTGSVYSDSVIERLASMKTKAVDFRIYWDNAYSVHSFAEAPRPIASLLDACKKAGHEDRALVFASSSKITFAGAGISFLAASAANLSDFKKHLQIQTIGPDKLNILRHVQFFKTWDQVLSHMNRHAEILAPKFKAVDAIFSRELTGYAEWSRPKGGYFVSLNTKPGLAKRVVSLAAELGVKLTAAGATFPYKKDPHDQNIRIAPSLPPLSEVEEAMEALCVCIKLATLEQTP